MSESASDLLARHAAIIAKLAEYKKRRKRTKKEASIMKLARVIGSMEYNRLTVEGEMRERGIPIPT